MPASFKSLGLTDLILQRKGTLVFRIVLAAFAIALRLFFRRIETVNAEAVPKRGGLIFVLNHPNGLVDPALVFVSLPRKISFLAKSTLFRTPVISSLLRMVEALPLYRRIDSGEDVDKNKLTFEACRKLLEKGGSIALFPEGVSHNSPKLLPIKTGAARIALGAVSIESADRSIDIQIVPVGLYYTSKTTFRSEAMLHFGEPFAVKPVVLDADGEPSRADVRDLTGKIEEALKKVTVNAETDAELQTARIAESIFASSAENEQLGEKFDFLKNYIAETGSPHDGLSHKIQDYDKKLEKYGIEAVHLSLAQFSRRFVIKQALWQSWLLILLLPVAVAGGILHFPAYQLCKVFAFYYTHHGADDIVSTVKVLAAMLFMPLTWLITALVLYFVWNWQAAVISIPLAALSGYIALYTFEELEVLRGWARAIWLFMLEKEKFFRLYVERRELQKDLKAFD